MTEERWVVTHATEHGATRMWWVSEATADFLDRWLAEPVGSDAKAEYLSFRTLTGRAAIWYAPGQSLTVEKSNG